MPKLALFLIGLGGIASAGCQSASSPDHTGTLIEHEPAAPLAHEVYTGFGEPARLVVRDARLWAEVWDRTFMAMSEVPERPTIDFTKDMVVVAAQGGQPSSGYDISIDRVATRDGAITVNVTTTSPDASCVVLAVITAPVVIVRLPRPAGQVRFIEHSRVLPCD